MSYSEFLNSKFALTQAQGFAPPKMPDSFFPMQSDLTGWAIKRGRAAIFADTGLGKSRMQIAWADAVVKHTQSDAMIFAPLAVAQQTVKEGASIGINITYCREESDLRPGINISNYERMHKFDSTQFKGVVLDESSIIKHHDAKTFRTLTEMYGTTPYRFCATATPAPNDWTEFGTHAEFLGICSRAEMLAEFFTHDGGETSIWRLKGHARELFWKWVASWAAFIRRPSDLGYDDSLYNLPPLKITEHVVKTSMPTNGMLFAMEAQTLSERRDARRFSLADRVEECAAIVNNDKQSWVVWCDLNAEGDALKLSIPGAVEIRGSDDADVKEKRLIDFASGKIRVLITKPSIAGFGLNWQHCARMAFVGVTDSFEAYYQAVRRCWRFGQTKEVNVHVFSSEAEGAVVANLKRKERDVIEMGEQLSAETREAVYASIKSAQRHTNVYNPAQTVKAPAFLEAA